IFLPVSLVFLSGCLCWGPCGPGVWTPWAALQDHRDNASVTKSPSHSLTNSHLTNGPSNWPAFVEDGRHFHFQYPPAWKICTESYEMMHYRYVLVSVNSFGR